MIRRDFLKGGALAVAGAGLQKFGAAATQRSFVLENKQLAWRLEAGQDGIGPIGFENRLAGHNYKLRVGARFCLDLLDRSEAGTALVGFQTRG